MEAKQYATKHPMDQRQNHKKNLETNNVKA